MKVSGTESSEASTSSKMRLSSSAVLEALLAPGCGHRNCRGTPNSFSQVKRSFPRSQTKHFFEKHVEAEVSERKYRENNVNLGRLHTRASQTGDNGNGSSA